MIINDLFTNKKLNMAEALTDYQRRRQRERDVDAGKPVARQPKNPQNDYFARRKKEKEQGMAEGIAGKVVFSGTGDNNTTYEIIQSSPTDYMIHANGKHVDTYSSLQRAMSVLQNEVPGLQQGMAENQDWMKDLAARAAAKSKPGTPYVPPKQDAEKQRRDLTARYPNIDELVAAAERNRDPYYDRAEGEAYYRGREAEQQYQRLKQIQRVIQGLNESQADAKKKELGTGTGRINPDTGRPWTPSELKAKYRDVDFDREEKQAERKRLKDLAKQERLKDKIKASLDDPRDTASDLAKSFVNKGMDFKPPVPVPPTRPTVAPAPTTGKAQPPGFTASNLAQQPGMAQYMQPTPTAARTAPNFAQGPGGYTNVQTTISTPTVAPTTPPTQIQDVYDSLVQLGYLPKAAAAAVKRLPPNISTQDAIKQILKNTP